jgi:DNA repair photolyase
MAITEVKARSLIRKHKRIDSWFLSRYGMNIYRGCMHDCVYCDGRCESYFVEGEFGRDIEVKVNAHELARQELNPARKRKPMESGFILLGGGVSDSYQPAEANYGLTRKVLEVISDYGLPLHLLTKSLLVERDMDLIKRINDRASAIVSFSFSSTHDKISRIFEPGVPAPSQKLKTISRIRNAGIACGMFLMPVIPFITDTEEILEQSIMDARDAGAQYIIFGGMTLKKGRQKDHFYNTLRKSYPGLVKKYDDLYEGSDRWGGARGQYPHQVYQRFFNLANEYRMPARIPASLFSSILNPNDRVIVMLEHILHIQRLMNEKTELGKAIKFVSALSEPLIQYRSGMFMQDELGSETWEIIDEIIQRGTCPLYEKYIYNQKNMEHESYQGRS